MSKPTLEDFWPKTMGGFSQNDPEPYHEVVFKLKAKERECVMLQEQLEDQSSIIFALQRENQDLRNPLGAKSTLPLYSSVTKSPLTQKLTSLGKTKNPRALVSPFSLSLNEASPSSPDPNIPQTPVQAPAPTELSAPTQTFVPNQGSKPLPTEVFALLTVHPPPSSPVTCPAPAPASQMTPAFQAQPMEADPPKMIPNRTRTTPPKPSRPYVPPHKFGPKVVPKPDHPSELPQKVRIYHDSNLKWSSPKEIQNTISDLHLKDSKNLDISLSYTPKLEHMVSAVERDDNKNAIVVIATMTNNAKDHESLAKCQYLLRKAFAILQRQTPMENVIFLESPPSLKFDIFFYNRMVLNLCNLTGAKFAFNLLARPHIKSDGLHIKAGFKHLMNRSVASAIVRRDPYSLLGLWVPRRHPLPPFF